METKISDYVSKRDELAAPPEDIPNEIFLQSRGIVLASTSSSNEDTLLSGKQRAESEMKNEVNTESEGKDAVENSRSSELASTSSSTSAEQKNFDVNIVKTKKRSARSGYSSLPWKNVEK